MSTYVGAGAGAMDTTTVNPSTSSPLPNINTEYRKLYNKYKKLKSEYNTLKSSATQYASNLVELQQTRGASSRECQKRIEDYEKMREADDRERRILKSQSDKDRERRDRDWQNAYTQMKRERNEFERQASELKRGFLQLKNLSTRLEQENKLLKANESKREKAVENIKDQYEILQSAMAKRPTMGNQNDNANLAAQQAQLRQTMNAFGQVVNNLNRVIS